MDNLVAIELTQGLLITEKQRLFLFTNAWRLRDYDLTGIDFFDLIPDYNLYNLK